MLRCGNKLQDLDMRETTQSLKYIKFPQSVMRQKQSFSCCSKNQNMFCLFMKNQIVDASDGITVDSTQTSLSTATASFDIFHNFLIRTKP